MELEELQVSSMDLVEEAPEALRLSEAWAEEVHLLALMDLAVVVLVVFVAWYEKLGHYALLRMRSWAHGT
jgi:hypothetical protein